ncbi:MAG: hypothetical protein ACI9QC_000979, partial [Oceanicoccus sp.]
MKLRHVLTTALITALFAMPLAQAASFESSIQSGFIKKNSIITEHFRLEFSD